MGVLGNVVKFRSGRWGGTDDFDPGFLDVSGRFLGSTGLGERRELLFQVLGGDFIQRTRRDFGCRDAKLLGLVQDEPVFEAEFLGDIVNANGHVGSGL
jgi:hypothetical protein